MSGRHRAPDDELSDWHQTELDIIRIYAANGDTLDNLIAQVRAYLGKTQLPEAYAVANIAQNALTLLSHGVLAAVCAHVIIRLIREEDANAPR